MSFAGCLGQRGRCGEIGRRRLLPAVTIAVIRFFADTMRAGDGLVVEDGVIESAICNRRRSSSCSGWWRCRLTLSSSHDAVFRCGGIRIQPEVRGKDGQPMLAKQINKLVAGTILSIIVVDSVGAVACTEADLRRYRLARLSIIEISKLCTDTDGTSATASADKAVCITQYAVCAIGNTASYFGSICYCDLPPSPVIGTIGYRLTLPPP